MTKRALPPRSDAFVYFTVLEWNIFFLGFETLLTKNMQWKIPHIQIKIVDYDVLWNLWKFAFGLRFVCLALGVAFGVGFLWGFLFACFLSPVNNFSNLCWTKQE